MIIVTLTLAILQNLTLPFNGPHVGSYIFGAWAAVMTSRDGICRRGSWSSWSAVIIASISTIRATIAEILNKLIFWVPTCLTQSLHWVQFCSHRTGRIHGSFGWVTSDKAAAPDNWVCHEESQDSWITFWFSFSSGCTNEGCEDGYAEWYILCAYIFTATFTLSPNLSLPLSPLSPSLPHPYLLSPPPSPPSPSFLSHSKQPLHSLNWEKSIKFGFEEYLKLFCCKSHVARNVP